ncbi:MAG: trigger factor [Muribaculaceae bacterium]|nr:trigger factor [Muribaculaceae bacterium]
MNVTMNKLDNVNATLTVALEEKDYQDKVKKALREINQNRPEPGFRPGKVPAGLIQKKYGKAVKYDVINREVADAIYNYIKENEIQVLGNPVPVKNDDFNLDDKDFTFEFKVGIAPAIDTHVNKEMHIPYYTIEVSEDMIQRQDEMLRRRYGSQVPGDTVEPNALVKGVITELDENGAPKAEGIVVENGIVSPQYFKSDEQRDLFIGKHVGDVVRFNPAATCEGNEAELSSMLGIAKEETAAHHGDFNLEIKEIIVLKPAEDGEEYYTNVFGKDKVHDAEEYKAALKDMIANQLQADSNYRFTIDGKDMILKAVGDIELPDAILKDYLKQQDEKLNDENIDAEYDRLRPDLVWQLVREAIAKQLEVKVTRDDALELAKAIAQNQFAQYGMSGLPDDVLTKYAEDMLNNDKTREQIFNQAVDSRLWAEIKQTVTVDDKTVSVEDFNALFKAPDAQ